MGLFARRPKLAVDLPPKLAVDEGNLSGTTPPLATDSEPSDQDANSDVASEPAGGGWDASDKSTDSWELVQQQAKAEGEAALEEYAAGLAGAFDGAAISRSGSDAQGGTCVGAGPG